MANGLFNLKQQLQGLIRGAWSGTSSSNAPKYLEYLVVAGGGSGAGNRGLGGGGGAGGLLQGLLPITLGTSYTVTVGAGGVDSSSANGGVGGNSVFGAISASGGGTGGEASASASGYPGGSGGGGGNNTVGRPGGSAVSGQGNYGGTGYSGGSPYGGGGGGGAGTVGLNATLAGGGGNGGAGIASAISGTVVAYAGGGGGAALGTVQGTGGVGGGGSGSGGSAAPTAGSANTGGGGGADGRQTQGGNGGSGIVIVRYAGTTQYFTGGTLSYANGFVSHTFYASGTLAPLATPTTYANFSYAITKSLRFRSSNSAYLSRTPGSAGSRTTWTFSVWLKRGVLTGPTKEIFTASSGGEIYFGPDSLTFYDNSTSYFTTSQIFQDPSAWYHIVIVWDTTQATSSNRIKVYVNGTRVTSFAATNYPAQNTTSSFNNNTLHYIGEYFGGGSYYYDGEMAEINFIDGQALTSLSFGATSPTTGVWQPIAFVGTYGTNGFYLPFTNTTSTTTLGYDSSGNSNNWTTTGFSLTAGSTYDSMTDSPTLTSATNSNYATFNPLVKVYSQPTLSNGNLLSTAPAGWSSAIGTIGLTSGKWYWEIVNGAADAFVGICGSNATLATDPPQSSTATILYYGNTGNKRIDTVDTAYGTAFSTQTIGVALDIDGGTIVFYRNNVSQGSISLSSSTLYGKTIFPLSGVISTTATVNFGQQGFTYTPPSGYVALNTYNLPTPAIVQGNQYMDATIYPGTGPSQAIMNAGQFQPDFVWMKRRNFAGSNILQNSVTGVTKGLSSDDTSSQFTDGTTLTAFNANGFTVNGNSQTNAQGSNYVAWQWQAGKGVTSTNTSGTITSTVCVNTTLGFSVVTYPGNNTVGATRGHGLNALPKMILIKGTTGTYSVDQWHVYHASIPITQGLILNSSGAAITSSYFWNDTNPTTSVFSTSSGSSNNGSGTNYVAYCWSEIPGFSAFGSYLGNGSASGAFVYTGFQPKFIMIKSSTLGSTNWVMLDTARIPANTSADAYLFANLTDTESNFTFVNILSNGFQVNSTGSYANSSGNTYIYAAFASNPFKYANAF